MNVIEELSIQRISGELAGFHRANGHYNFRCPYCGDSAKSKLKRRGWFFDYQGEVFYKCFNCDKSTSYRGFLKDWFPAEFDRYNQEKLFSDGKSYETKKSSPTPIFGLNREMFESLVNVLPVNGTQSGEYLANRKVNPTDNFFHTNNYGELLKELNLTEYEPEFVIDNPRLLIPHFNRRGILSYIQMRNLGTRGVRYKTYKVSNDEYKLWNIDRVDLNKKIYVTEGAIDASFLKNAVAMSGSDAQLEKSILGTVKKNLRIILDNEPRNGIILQKYRKLIESGYLVFHWPNTECKDINDCILDNFDICKYIYDDSNYFRGMKGQLDFATWKKY